MSSWAAAEDAGARAREAIDGGQRLEALRILGEQHGYGYARDVLRSLNRDVARVKERARTRPPAEA